MEQAIFRNSYSPSIATRTSTIQNVKSSLMHNRPVIAITLKGEENGSPLPNAYSTFDTVEGEISITAPQDTRFDDIFITFEGNARIWTERMTPSPAMGNNRLEVNKNFLKMNQPVDENTLPIPRIAEKGRTYKFPFSFLIPENLLDNACGSEIVTDAVRRAHLQVPPTLGTGNSLSHDGKLELDDVSPDMTRIRYMVKARVCKRRQSDNRQIVLVEQTRNVHVIPSFPELPPILDDTYVLKREKDIRKGLFKGKLGKLAIEADYPKPLEVKPRTFMTTPASTVIPVHLSFYPTDESLEPPKLGTLTAKLKYRTHFSTRHINYSPQRKATSYDGLMGQYVESVTLASRQLNGVKWHKGKDLSDADSAYGSIRRGSNSTTGSTGTTCCSSTSGAWYTEVLVPISQPKNKALTPSFQSCFVSRSYELDISISLESSSRITTSPVLLKLPLQVTAKSSAAPAEWEPTEPPSIDDFFTPRSIAPPEGIPTLADLRLNEDGMSQLPSHMMSRPNMPPPPDYGYFSGPPANVPVRIQRPVGFVAPGCI